MTHAFPTRRSAYLNEPGRYCRGPVPKGQTGSGRHGPLDSRRFIINSGSKEELRSAKQTGRGMMLKLMTLVKASPTFDHAGFRDYWAGRYLPSILAAPEARGIVRIVHNPAVPLHIRDDDQISEGGWARSEEHTSEIQSLTRTST